MARVRTPSGAQESADASVCLSPMFIHTYQKDHVKDPVVHVRVQWITEKEKNPACTKKERKKGRIISLLHSISIIMATIRKRTTTTTK